MCGPGLSPQSRSHMTVSPMLYGHIPLLGLGESSRSLFHFKESWEIPRIGETWKTRWPPCQREGGAGFHCRVLWEPLEFWRRIWSRLASSWVGRVQRNVRSHLEFQKWKVLFQTKSPVQTLFLLSPSVSCVQTKVSDRVPSQQFQSSKVCTRFLVFLLSISFCCTYSEISIKSMQILGTIFLPCRAEWLKIVPSPLSNSWKYFFLFLRRSWLFFSWEYDSEQAFFFFPPPICATSI